MNEKKINAAKKNNSLRATKGLIVGLRVLFITLKVFFLHCQHVSFIIVHPRRNGERVMCHFQLVDRLFSNTLIIT